MRVGIVFHKDPVAPPLGIDLVRLRAIALGLQANGVAVEIISPFSHGKLLDEKVPIRQPEALRERGRYDVVKTSYHYSLELLDGYHGPVVSRIVRVVDEKVPERDAATRPRLLACQELIRRFTTVLALNNDENRVRWRTAYGKEPKIVLVPTGCPAVIPPPGPNPFGTGGKVALFLGSVAAPRMVDLLNEAARRLAGTASVHLVGSNKAAMYGGDRCCALDSSIVQHGEIPEHAVWNFLAHAHVGLAFASGPHAFDNDLSKVLNYLRAGLPIVSEERVVNNRLIRHVRYGEYFRFGDGADLAAKVRLVLRDPPTDRKAAVMRYMADRHSWDRRVETYLRVFRRLVA